MIAAIPSLPVKDLMVSLQFYKDKLGFQLVEFEKTCASLRHEGVDLRLLEKSEGTVMYCGFYVVNIHRHLPDVLNVKQLGDIGKLRLNGQGELRFSMRDPDGNTIELIEQASKET
ncbi:VOC family protein [Bacillus sp. JCM 19041]|uniref:VOC family protein n=1 Tax=Bacillus sp. JCM 19041 TaxID=1460637 RepID=UPI0006D1C4D5